MDIQPRQRAVAVAACVAAILAAPASAAARGTLADGFGARPVTPRGATIPPSYFDLQARPGRLLTRSVIVSNGSKKTLRYRVDGVDGLTGRTSGVVYANRTDPRHAAGRWLRPSKTKLRLAPGESERVRFTIRVPRNAQPGDHLGGLAFEDRHRTTSSSRFAVTQVMRVVVGVKVNVPNGAPAQGAVDHVVLEALPGTQVPAVVVAVANTGQRLCHPKLAVSLTDHAGHRTAATQQLDTVLPGDRINYPVGLGKPIEAGQYAATAAIAGCGNDQSINATVRLGSPLSGTTPHAAVARAAVASHASTSALLLIGIGVGGIVLGVGGSVALGRRPRPTPEVGS